MSQDHDPWDWVNQKKPVAPLAAGVQASQDQAPGPMQVQQSPLSKMAETGAVNATAKGLEAGYKGYQAANAETAFQAADAAQLAGQGLEAAQVASTIGASAAPLAAGAEAAATTSALGTAAGVGGETALAAMGPVGWAIGAGLLAKKLKLF